MTTDTLQTDLLAQTRGQPMILFLLQALGPMGVPLIMTSLLAFTLTFLILRRGQGSFAGAALLLAVFSPLMVGLFAGFHSASNAMLIMLSAEAAEVMPGTYTILLSEACTAPSTALLLSAPTYLLAMIGSFTKACQKPPSGDSE